MADHSNRYAFVAMTTLFFIWGFLTALNDILIPSLKGAFELNYTQVMLVQFCFFGAYFIVSPLAGKLIEVIGYQRGIIVGLIVMAVGCLLFYPAAEAEVYAVFLVGLFILAGGITILQVSANPYVSLLGPERTATSRLNLAQAINSLGHTLAPFFGALLILGAAHEAMSAKSVQLPYLILAAAILITAIIFSRLNLPTISFTSASAGKDSTEVSGTIWEHKTLLYGGLAIFLYVGAEVSVGSFLVNFFTQEHIGNLSLQDAGKLVSYYWGGAMIGRFIGAVLTRYVQPYAVLGFNGAAAIVLITVTLFTQGEIAMWCIIAVGLFNSIMFPTIFTLAIQGLGGLTSKASGLLCQAIVGGAVIPLVQGLVADTFTIQLSFIVPACCYAYIIWFALRRVGPSYQV